MDNNNQDFVPQPPQQGTQPPPPPPQGFQPPPPPPPPPIMPQEQSDYYPGKGMAIASLVIGAASLVFCWIPFFGTIMAIVGLILGIVGKKSASEAGVRSGVATGGIICSAISIGISVLVTSCILCGAMNSWFYL
ncbi:MAG: DUF4190 domain-containing protein [Oscillospiraceae bacterium]|nr:DUF4190 domain-containing protein [Oscillospiraceae bacterium]